jgi:hypothetical protein
MALSWLAVISTATLAVLVVPMAALVVPDPTLATCKFLTQTARNTAENHTLFCLFPLQRQIPASSDFVHQEPRVW